MREHPNRLYRVRNPVFKAVGSFRSALFETKARTCKRGTEQLAHTRNLRHSSGETIVRPTLGVQTAESPKRSPGSRFSVDPPLATPDSVQRTPEACLPAPASRPSLLFPHIFASRAALLVPSYLPGARASRAAAGSILPLVKVDVAQVQRRRLGGRHLGVVEEDPAAFLLDVAHVVAARSVAAQALSASARLRLRREASPCGGEGGSPDGVTAAPSIRVRAVVHEVRPRPARACAIAAQ